MNPLEAYYDAEDRYHDPFAVDDAELPVEDFITRRMDRQRACASVLRDLLETHGASVVLSALEDCGLTTNPMRLEF